MFLKESNKSNEFVRYQIMCHILSSSRFNRIIVFYKHIGRSVDAELFSSKKCFRINIFLAYSKQVGKTNVLDMDAFTIKSVEII